MEIILCLLCTRKDSEFL